MSYRGWIARVFVFPNKMRKVPIKGIKTIRDLCRRARIAKFRIDE